MKATITSLTLVFSLVFLSGCSHNTLSESDTTYRDMLLSDAEINYFVQISNEYTYISVIDGLLRKYNPDDVSTFGYLEQTVGAIKLWEHTYPYEPGRMVTLKNLDLSIRDELIKQKDAEELNFIISKLRKTIQEVSERVLEPLAEQHEQRISFTAKQTIQKVQNELSVLRLNMSVLDQAQSSKFNRDSDSYTIQLNRSFNKINQSLDKINSILASK
ncbi:hypothetical protein ACFSO0_03740 [Brevibacillus sp. GCM10020057]|uniref:hypothetical protein n=1 Tax=Brevibacillus sp. GCM10020057 TaxID=3317327 RepID=UPI003632ECDB